VAPALAAAGNFLLWRLVVAVGGPAFASRFALIALFFVAGAASFLVCFFLCGLAGGFDQTALDELARAAEMSPLVRPIARLFAGAARAGSHLSPLRDRFTVAVAPQAYAEAHEIEAAARRAH
jgi:hypothetical protein